MYAWTRILPIAAMSLLRRQVSLFDRCELQFRALPGDTDLAVMNNAAYLRIMEAGRVDLMIRSGSLKPLLANRVATVASSIHISYRRPIPRWERFKLGTELVYFDDEAFYMRQRFEGGRGILAEGWVTIVCLQGRKKVPTSQILQMLGIQLAPEFEEPEEVRLLKQLRSSARAERM